MQVLFIVTMVALVLGPELTLKLAPRCQIIHSERLVYSLDRKQKRTQRGGLVIDALIADQGGRVHRESGVRTEAGRLSG